MNGNSLLKLFVGSPSFHFGGRYLKQKNLYQFRKKLLELLKTTITEKYIKEKIVLKWSNACR